MAAISRTRNVVFDIDGVLVGHYLPADKNPLLFHRLGLITTAIKTHYVFPGVVELLQTLYQQDIRISFFSSAEKERNVVLVQQLLQKALPGQKYLEILNKTQILSKEDLTSNSPESRESENPYQPGNRCKDLKKIIQRDDDIQDAVLVEDDSSYAKADQYKNLLKVKASDPENFFEGTELDCTPDGHLRIPYCIIQEWTPGDERGVSEGSMIALLRNEQSFLLIFRNANGEVEKVSLEDASLIESLLKTPNEPEVRDRVYKEIEKLGGKTRTVLHQANRIYYIAGILFQALGKSNRERISLREALYQIQFPNGKEREYEEDSFFEEGLKILKGVNPSLSFINPLTIQSLKPATQDETRILEEAVQNQSDDCVLM